jgi:hypothetical protein
VTGLVALLAVALGAGSPGDAYDGVRTALRRNGVEERTNEELTRALVALGPKSIPLLYSLVLGAGLDGLIGKDWIPAAWACQPEEIPDLCRRALAQMPAKEVIAHLAQVARSRPEIKERVVAMRILSGLRAAEGLQLVWSTTQELGALELGYPSVRTAVRGAMGAILSHTPTAWEWVDEHLEETDPATAQLLVETLGEIRLPQGMAVLEELLSTGSLPEAKLLSSMVELEAHSPWQLAGATARHLERCFRAQEPERRALAAALAGQLLLASSVPELLATIEDVDPRVRAAAAHALARMSNRPSDLDPTAWASWYEAELSWREKRVPNLLGALTGPRPGPASEALKELFTHPLWKRELARETASRLAKAPHPVGISACALLEHAHVRDALPGLVQTLEARDPRLKKAAWRALQGLSGKDLPLDLASWRELVQTSGL